MKHLEKTEKEVERAANKYRFGSSSTGIKKGVDQEVLALALDLGNLKLPFRLSCCPKYWQGCHESLYWGHVLLWTLCPFGKDVSKENSASREPACVKQGWHN